MFHKAGIDLHLGQAPARGGKDGVGDRGNEGLWPGLTHPAGRLRTLDDVYLDGRRIVDAKHLIGIEVRLLHPSVLERDLAIQRRRSAKGDPALDLRLYRVGIDDRADIGCTNHASNADGSGFPYLHLTPHPHLPPAHTLAPHTETVSLPPPSS